MRCGPASNPLANQDPCNGGFSFNEAAAAGCADAGEGAAPIDEIVFRATRRSFGSSELLRLTAPGQVSYDHAVSAYLNQEYLNSALFGAAMLAEQTLAVLTAGQGDKIARVGRGAVTAGGKLLGPTGPVIGRQRLGGSSLLNINSNPNFRVGWGYRASTNNQVLRFGGDWVRCVTGRSHIDLPITAPNPPGY